jgi:hypothetical protein
MMGAETRQKAWGLSGKKRKAKYQGQTRKKAKGEESEADREPSLD